MKSKRNPIAASLRSAHRQLRVIPDKRRELRDKADRRERE